MHRELSFLFFNYWPQFASSSLSVKLAAFSAEIVIFSGCVLPVLKAFRRILWIRDLRFENFFFVSRIFNHSIVVITGPAH